TLIIVLIILFALALAGWSLGRWQEAAAAPSLDQLEQRYIAAPISRYEQKFIDLDRGAIEAAYHDQIKHLFEGWMKQAEDESAPRRAVVGAKNARKAFERSMQAVEQRQQRLKEQQ